MSRRLLVWTLIGSLLPSILLMAVLLRLNYLRARKSLEHYVSQVAQLIAESARDYLLIAPEDLKELLSSMQEHPGFRAAGFLDKDNKILLLHHLDRREALHLSGLASRSFIELSDGRLVYRIVLGKGENALGSIVLVYDTKELHSWANETMWLSLLLLAAGMAVTSVFVTIMGRTLLQPIISLRDTALKVSTEEDYGARARKHLDDELGDVCDAFNLMLDRIQQRDQALQEAKDELEQRVTARTKDLNESKEKAMEIASSLLESNHRIRAILETAADGILSVDGHGRIESFNRAAEVMFEVSAGEVLGGPVTLFVPLERQEGYKSLLEEQLGQYADEDMVLSRVLEARRSGGEVFPAHVSLSSFRIGGQRKYTVLIRDITLEELAAEEKAELHRKLVETSRFAGMAEIATGVLHNVGNILNSLNLASSRLGERLSRSKLDGLGKVLLVLMDHREDLGTFLEEDGRGQEILLYLDKLSHHLEAERQELIRDVESMSKNVEHIRQVVAQQQDFAKGPGMKEDFYLSDLLDDALEIHLGALKRDAVEIIRDYEDLPMLHTDKHRILQILVNLVSNAQLALSTWHRSKRLELRVKAHDGLQIAEVRDNGPGIDSEHQAKIFNHGFTTRKEGHGFGLHSSANAAQAVGGQLLMESDGPGQGATFQLRLSMSQSSEISRKPVVSS